MMKVTKLARFGGRKFALLAVALMAAMALRAGVTCLFEGATMKV